MTTTPPTPATVEPGQVWRDNDQRSRGAGEFVVEAVETVDTGRYSGRRTVARVRREATGRRSTIAVARLLRSAHKQRGYTYLGMQR